MSDTPIKPVLPKIPEKEHGYLLQLIERMEKRAARMRTYSDKLEELKEELDEMDAIKVQLKKFEWPQGERTAFAEASSNLNKCKQLLTNSANAILPQPKAVPTNKPKWPPKAKSNKGNKK